MSLTHKFAAIKKDNKNQYIISSKVEFATLSDEVFLYIKDSLNWIHSNWCGNKVLNGLAYEGFSYIEDIANIKKFEEIILHWKYLFELAPDEFFIKGDFNANESKYEKILLKKIDVIKELSNILVICQKAIEIQGIIIHNGI